MDTLFWVAIILLALVVGVVIALACGTACFYRLTILRKPTATLENNINANTNWYQHIDFISKRREWFDAQPMEEVYIKSYDGLKLHATLLKNKTESKKTVICFHGYTSCGKNDYPSLAKFYYEACKSDKELLIVEGADHAESYYVNPAAYEAAVSRFIDKYAN